jgi:hypothetical protein
MGLLARSQHFFKYQKDIALSYNSSSGPVKTFKLETGMDSRLNHILCIRLNQAADSVFVLKCCLAILSSTLKRTVRHLRHMTHNMIHVLLKVVPSAN